MPTKDRNRQPAGAPVGGQYAGENGATTGLALTITPDTHVTAHGYRLDPAQDQRREQLITQAQPGHGTARRAREALARLAAAYDRDSVEIALSEGEGRTVGETSARLADLNAGRDPEETGSAAHTWLRANHAARTGDEATLIEIAASPELHPSHVSLIVESSPRVRATLAANPAASPTLLHDAAGATVGSWREADPDVARALVANPSTPRSALIALIRRQALPDIRDLARRHVNAPGL